MPVLLLDLQLRVKWRSCTFFICGGVPGTAASRVALGAEKASTFVWAESSLSSQLSSPHHGLSSDLIGMGHAIQQAQEARIMSTGTVEPQWVSEHNTNPRDSFTIHPCDCVIKRPQPQAQHHHGRDGMEQTICLQQRNKPKNLLRGDEEKASELALIKWPATEKGEAFLFLVLRMREKKGEWERFAITANWKVGEKPVVLAAPLWFVCILSE